MDDEGVDDQGADDDGVDVQRRHDALLVLSFGGPEGPDDVLPFLENVLRGRNVPRERMLAVAEHYQRFGGVSPINAQNRALVDALRTELAATGSGLPVYWGNRNWHPMLADTVAAMRDDGIRNAAVFVTSAFGSYSGCRQYREDLKRAGATVPGAPALHKLRLFFDHPGFVEAVADGLGATLTRTDATPAGAGDAPLVWFSAHSLPESMAAGTPYEAQLRTAAARVAERCGVAAWELVYQSRSGPPGQAWLGPDVGDRLPQVPKGATVVVCPIGFVSDHMEVVYDLDVEAAAIAAGAGVRFLRAPTAGTHPAFVRMILDLVAEADDPGARPVAGARPGRPVAGQPGASPGCCPPGCCPSPARYAPTG